MGGIRKIMVLWQAVFLAASPLVTAPPSNLTRLYYNGSAAKSHSTILQRLCRQISLDYYTIPPATQAICIYVCKSLFKHGKSSVKLKLKTAVKPVLSGHRIKLPACNKGNRRLLHAVNVLSEHPLLSGWGGTLLSGQ